MTRRAFIEEIAARIGRRKFLWFGLYGANARALTPLPQFSAAYSIVAPAGLPDGREVCLEQFTRERIDTLGYELRPERSEAEGIFYRRLYASLGVPTVAVTHQVHRDFASLCFLRHEFVQHLGLFHERQAVFDHKPWVETELRSMGVRVLPWRYLATHDAPGLRRALEDALRDGPVVVRTNRSGGGHGLTLIRQPEEIPAGVADGGPDGFIAMAPFLTPSVPLNVGACVFLDGTVSLHGPSLQLLGIPGSATGPLNYCGNDFARVRDLDRTVLQALHEMTERAGRWLFAMGYVGAFGVDAVLHQDTVYLSEVNPRFQGSSLLSSDLDAALDRPDVFLAHVGAFLGLAAPGAWELEALAREQPPAAQIYVRNGHDLVARNASPWRPPGGVVYWMLPDPGVIVHPDVLLCRAIVPGAVTEDGWRLRDDVTGWYAELPKRLFDVKPTA